ncbi:unnamed protein product [Ambrosiozyma monospora]|uniref:Unnamed protein product n=1 Tax=Ambrosiozyma monospora TaxID=43982 RepID=A0ACB5U0P9_AMBMO|nr:unnamed protein product [Ambrosiozyma monospora]
MEESTDYYQNATFMNLRHMDPSNNPINYTRLFVPCTVLAFLVQIIGAGLSGHPDQDKATIGVYILFAGMLWQVLIMTIFLLIAVYFAYKVSVNKNYLDQRFTAIRKTSFFKGIMLAFGGAFTLFYARSIYRVVELANGFGSHIMHNETLFLVLDGALCTLAVLLLSVFHPGFAFKRTKKAIQVDTESILMKRKLTFEFSSLV